MVASLPKSLARGSSQARCGQRMASLAAGSGVGLLRRKVGPVMLVWISRLSGLVIVGFGLWALVAALR